MTVSLKTPTLNDHAAAVLQTHFDPRWGTPFWLHRAKELGMDPRSEISTPEDLAILGNIPRETLVNSPIEDFIPMRYHDRLHECITAETGGTTGPATRTVYLDHEFHDAFVAPFLAAAEYVSFPRDEHWLYIGPSGPHVIGKAARACATSMGSVDPFAVDFDPRWVRKLPADSMARQRYVEHVLLQAEQILASQHIGVLFATPPVLEALGARLPQVCREQIRGVHLGGMAARSDFWRKLTAEWFPKSVALGGYGNSLAGLCPQLSLVNGELPAYFPHGDRLQMELRNPDEREYGQVVFHRLDYSCLLPNMAERDVARPVRLGKNISGFSSEGLLDPRPPKVEEKQMAAGLY